MARLKKSKGIVTPDILPGEPGWEKLQAKKKREKEKAKLKSKVLVKKAPKKIGNITTGGNGLRIGREIKTYTGKRRYPVWRYRRQVGEIVVENEENNSKISLSFIRLGGKVNHQNLIQDLDFQKKWNKRKKELLENQKGCYLCGKNISKTAKPNLFHYKLFKKKSEILERAEKVPLLVVGGKLNLEEGWKEFNNVLEDGNRYYMSLKDTTLICAHCAKNKGLNN